MNDSFRASTRAPRWAFMRIVPGSEMSIPSIFFERDDDAPLFPMPNLSTTIAIKIVDVDPKRDSKVRASTSILPGEEGR